MKGTHQLFDSPCGKTFLDLISFLEEPKIDLRKCKYSWKKKATTKAKKKRKTKQKQQRKNKK
jgi:hypothetical protein